MSAGGGEDYFHHVRDFPYFELPFHQKLYLPEIMGFQITKFMVLQVVAGFMTLFIFGGLARRARSGQPVKGRFWNFWEAIALFIRDEVVRPTIGEAHHHDDHGHGEEGHESHAVAHAADVSHHADKYLPFVWTCFFYILICNLLGAIPMLGSATGSISVTVALAAVTFAATIFYSMKEIGFGGFFKNFMGGIEVKGPMDLAVVAILIPIEIVGFLIKHGVLAIRLFANIMGGHTVLGLLLIFISMAAKAGSAYYIVAPASVLGQVGVGLLELMVAFIQAYVFSFLATIFIATGLHEH
ncbi:MAG: F0F1 ATP synthase subunit A [Planctomycetaceae bacterium]